MAMGRTTHPVKIDVWCVLRLWVWFIKSKKKMPHNVMRRPYRESMSQIVSVEFQECANLPNRKGPSTDVKDCTSDMEPQDSLNNPSTISHKLKKFLQLTGVFFRQMIFYCFRQKKWNDSIIKLISKFSFSPPLSFPAVLLMLCNLILNTIFEDDILKKCHWSVTDQLIELKKCENNISRFYRLGIMGGGVMLTVLLYGWFNL